ncbi:MAG TPA: 4a-hydroxytetrahydrobiopterin dehydratase [Myxococcota bacterium]
MQVEHWQQTTRDDCAALTRTFTFSDWTQTLAFVNAIGALAQAQDHDPLVELTGGRVTLWVWSHDVRGLSSRDERFATAVNAL